MKFGRLLVELLLIGVGASLILFFARNEGMLERPDRLVYDLVDPLHAAPADDSIVIVAINNESLSRIGRWPWPRLVHADTLDRLNAARPAAIIYDALFIEPTADDPALAAAMKRGAPVFLPILFDIPGPNGAAYVLLQPEPSLGAAAAGLGTANLEIDSDGRARSIGLATRDGERWLPHLAELAYRTVKGHESPAYRRAVQSDMPVHVAFLPGGSFRVVSLHQVLRGEVPSAFLRDKIVIVGATAPGLGDLYPVPGSAALMPGAEIQANLLGSLFADRFISPLPNGWVMALSLLPLWLLLGAFWYLSPTNSLLISVGMIVAIILGSTLALAMGGIWFPPVAALMGVVIVYPLWGWRRLTVITRFIESQIVTLLAQTNMTEGLAGHGRKGDRVAEGASRLSHVIAYMRRSSAEREEMLQFLSHDMRAPQASIIALLDSTSGTGGEAERAAMEQLQGGFGRLAETTLGLADDFVSLARLETQKSVSEPLDVVDAMAQAGDMVWAKARAKGVVIDRQWASADDLWIMGDAAAIVRAFANLLMNAVEASSVGGHVRCDVRREGDDVVAVISDEGPGLPPERRADPFARFGYSGASAGGQGAGLGLAYVLAVARHHGGSADYADGEKGGACFTVRMPLVPDDMFSPDPES